MGVIEAFVWLNGGFCALSVVSALVSRAAARDTRALLRVMRSDLDYLASELELMRTQFRRIEGRQTARMGRDGAKPSATGEQLPDPSTNPEAWRAAVRLIGLKRQQKEQG